ncbi:receptor protein kinase TMK1-like [Neltuma alba]|uniref:receptor protein kinase TMK1-like n=1 Tax=Neltuma alba TaxID=207710 RepID=UPI0010A4612B|nr:receptor protein kinase TMK1-like [Prosopis alba]
MNILKKAINAPPSLRWTDADVCKWRRVNCNAGKSVISIQIGNLNLQGLLPKELENLSELQQFECPQNNLTGQFPYLSKTLHRLVIPDNKFSSIPRDFFKEMTMLQEVRIGKNPFSPWSIPDSLKDCVALQTFIATNANLVGTIPDFLGTMAGLISLVLNSNSLEGGLPVSFANSSIEELLLNTQNGNYKLNGTIKVLQNMTSLKKVWLHGNSFTGPIPDLSNLGQLFDVSVRDNQLACAVPSSLMALPRLQVVNLTNNFLQGPIPTFKSSVVVDVSGINRFCTNITNQPCSSLVNALLSVVEPLGCPVKLADNWKGNDPCNGSWTGIVCSGGNISIVNFQDMGLSGTISPTFASLTSVTKLLLANNSLMGPIPNELTTMPNLRELDVSNNNLEGYVPSFPKKVMIIRKDGNPNLGKPLKSPSSSSRGNGTKKMDQLSTFIAGIAVGLMILLIILVIVSYVIVKKRNYFGKFRGLITKLIRPRDGEVGKGMKIYVEGAGAPSQADVQGMVIPIQVLKEVTNNFSNANILGKGGFGTVYKGELHDGSKIAVKRMESGLLLEKGLSEFRAEIAVLTQARHKHLVALLGYCLDGNEKLLVYEYMPQGALSKHLFRWKENGLEPLDWTRRLNIALDVARGVEYLHALAQQSFIHRDLKPSNILLGDDMGAKVSDFGLVRLAPEGRNSVETRLAGTFGYLAPEYAATGRVTTKVDVYSFGVVLMEMITGRRVLDDSLPEEDFHLVMWFRRMMQNNDSFRRVIDPIIDADDEATMCSIRTVSELAGHCCASEPHQRPDMGYIVNLLSPLVQAAWKPMESSSSDDGKYGIDFDMSLPQALSKWQSLEGKSCSMVKGSSSQSFVTK